MSESTLSDDIKSMPFGRRLIHYIGLSGPGWIQAAVTLGGGTLVSALYLGVIGGYEFMWLQPLAMLCGVIMLAALSHITLSVKARPFRLAKQHISPSLAWGWLIATIVANVVFCAAQFALGTDAIQGNLGLSNTSPYIITAILFVASVCLIWYFSKEGKGARVIDSIIKGLVAIIVLAFLGVVIVLSYRGAIEWSSIFKGLIPNPSDLFQPTARFSESQLLELSGFAEYYEQYIVANQRDIIIGAFGTAVGINMTFLLPYTLIKKGWKKAERELARFDLFFGLFIPFIIGSSCLIIASASQFHAKENAVVNTLAYNQVIDARLTYTDPAYPTYDESRKVSIRSAVTPDESKLAIMLAKRNANDLANALKPFLGDWAQLIFGIGILAMALSTMVVHMMMNGYAISEAFNALGNHKVFMAGALIPASMGFLSPIVWSGSVKSALVVPASVIATALLPIAYLIIVLLMNSRHALGDERPQKRALINTAMFVAAIVATFASIWALWGKLESANTYEQYFGIFGLSGLAILAIIGTYSFIKKENSPR